MINIIRKNLNKSVSSNSKHFGSRFTRRFGSEVYTVHTTCALLYTKLVACVERRPRAKMKNEWQYCLESVNVKYKCEYVRSIVKCWKKNDLKRTCEIGLYGFWIVLSFRVFHCETQKRHKLWCHRIYFYSTI